MAGRDITSLGAAQLTGPCGPCEGGHGLSAVWLDPGLLGDRLLSGSDAVCSALLFTTQCPGLCVVKAGRDSGSDQLSGQVAAVPAPVTLGTMRQRVHTLC